MNTEELKKFAKIAKVAIVTTGLTLLVSKVIVPFIKKKLEEHDG